MTPYDKWRLSGPAEDSAFVGQERGEWCNRIHEPDEDAPRGYKPKPCSGSMCQDDDEPAYCDTCGEVA